MIQDIPAMATFEQLEKLTSNAQRLMACPPTAQKKFQHTLKSFSQHGKVLLCPKRMDDQCKNRHDTVENKMTTAVAAAAKYRQRHTHEVFSHPCADGVRKVPNRKKKKSKKVRP